MADKNEPRVYGMADTANRNPPAPQGLGGERSASKDGPAFSHMVTLDSGKPVVVSEDSGVSYAEATGRVGNRAREADSAASPQERVPINVLLGALVAGIGIGLLAAHYSRSGEAERPGRNNARDSRLRSEQSVWPA